MKAERKVLSLSLEYGDTREAEAALKQMINNLKSRRTNYDREKFNTAIMEWGIFGLDAEPYRVELINGKTCAVFQSKLNKKENG